MSFDRRSDQTRESGRLFCSTHKDINPFVINPSIWRALKRRRRIDPVDATAPLHIAAEPSDY